MSILQLGKIFVSEAFLGFRKISLRKGKPNDVFCQICRVILDIHVLTPRLYKKKFPSPFQRSEGSKKFVQFLSIKCFFYYDSSISTSFHYVYNIFHTSITQFTSSSDNKPPQLQIQILLRPVNANSYCFGGRSLQRKPNYTVAPLPAKAGIKLSTV